MKDEKRAAKRAAKAKKNVPPPVIIQEKSFKGFAKAGVSEFKNFGGDSKALVGNVG